MIENIKLTEREPRFTCGEYWMLESAVEMSLPMNCLASSDLELMLNKTGHKLDNPAIVNTLVRLFTNGLIKAWQRGKPNNVLLLTRDEIEAALREEKPSTYYSLTAKGGAQWEHFAHPRWDRFMDHGYEILSETRRKGELYCATEHLLESYFKGIHFLGYHVDSATVVRDVVKPWQATYWKQLPQAYRISFEFDEDSSHNWENMPYSFYCLHNNKWYDWG